MPHMHHLAIGYYKQPNETIAVAYYDHDTTENVPTEHLPVPKHLAPNWISLATWLDKQLMDAVDDVEAGRPHRKHRSLDGGEDRPPRRQRQR